MGNIRAYLFRRISQAFLAAFLAVSLMGVPDVAQADQNDPRLDRLFAVLQTSDDERELDVAQSLIWDIWITHKDHTVARLMRRGIFAMANARNDDALQIFDELIAADPGYAEAWNKRATIYYLLGNYPASQADIDSTLALEPFHFGALSGRAMVHLAQQEYFQARSAFHACLEIYPAMPGVRENLRLLEQMLEQRAI